jgi:hypothetical protein
MTIRVNPVIIKSTAGKNDSAVKKMSVCIGTEKLRPDAPVPTSNGSCPTDCACTEEYAAVTANRAKALLN